MRKTKPMVGSVELYIDARILWVPPWHVQWGLWKNQAMTWSVYDMWDQRIVVAAFYEGGENKLWWEAFPGREAKQNTQNKGHLRPVESALEQKGLETTQTNLSSKYKQLGKETMISLALWLSCPEKINAYEVVMGDQSENKITHRPSLLPWLLRIDILGG